MSCNPMSVLHLKMTKKIYKTQSSRAYNLHTGTKEIFNAVRATETKKHMASLQGSNYKMAFEGAI